jgi:hypothetical protein
MIISNKKFTDIYNKIINDIESLKSFYFNRYILELEFETLNFILGELIVSIPNLYNVINTIKKENNDRKILVRNVNNIRILINKIVLLIVISFSNDDKEDNDDFTCNNKEYNLNFFTSNKKNYNTIKIINDNFKIVTQNIEDIKKNNKIVIDNIKVNILFNKIKNNLDIINDLYLQQSLNIQPQQPPQLQQPPQQQQPQQPPTIKSKEITNNIITFKQFCSLNNKNKFKVIIKLIINIIKNIDYNEVNIYNITLFGFVFFLCFY